MVYKDHREPELEWELEWWASLGFGEHHMTADCVFRGYVLDLAFLGSSLLSFILTVTILPILT